VSEEKSVRICNCGLRIMYPIEKIEDLQHLADKHGARWVERDIGHGWRVMELLVPDTAWKNK